MSSLSDFQIIKKLGKLELFLCVSHHFNEYLNKWSAQTKMVAPSVCLIEKLQSWSNFLNKIWCLLGDGAYSSVYKVRRGEDQAVYALKKVKMLNLSDKEKENALNEVRILASIAHNNVIAYKEAFIDEPSSSLW